MLSRSEPLSDQAFRVLHRGEIRSPSRIRYLLDRARKEQTVLRRALNRHIEPEVAVVEEVFDDHLRLRTRNFENRHGSQVFLNFELDGDSFFFSAPPVGQGGDGSLELAIPAAIYQAERRLQTREAPEGRPRVALIPFRGRTLLAEIADSSARGLAVDLPADPVPRDLERVRVRFLDDRADREVYAELRHRERSPRRNGWLRFGLALSPVAPAARIAVERREAILEQRVLRRTWRRIHVTRAATRLAASRAIGQLGLTRSLGISVPIRDFRNPEGERIRAIVDAWGAPSQATAVIIPPAFAKTKETLLPLAATILETFRSAGQPIIVVRLDGIRRRGESHQEQDCLAPGREFLRYTFSQGVRDIHATADFLEAEYQPSEMALVTFSAAAVEGRRALATDVKRRFAAWVSVVGAPDLQRSLRVVTGGLDFVHSLARGVRLGQREVLGFTFDMDRAGRDAVENDLALIEDSRRDMAAVRVPVTWIHGRYDAWMNRELVRDVISSGDTSNRRLIEIPTGHQLRSSDEAFDTFGLIATELGRMTLGRRLRPKLPDLVALDRRREAERRRLPRPDVDLQGFWRRYLLGREDRGGIELMVETRAYRQLMGAQIRSLALRPGDRVADLGSGTGAFPLALAADGETPTPLRIDAVDYVPEALLRAQERWAEAGPPPGIDLRFILADLDVGPSGPRVPLASDRYDAILASLLLSYVRNPKVLLRELRRILRPGGRLVLSVLRRDADFSKIYVEELTAKKTGARPGDEAGRDVETLSHSFMNDAARLLDLEERGWFQFWDPGELAHLVRGAGFSRVRAFRSFGDPPQAAVVAARRP